VPVPNPIAEGGWLKLLPAGRAPSPNYFQDLERLQLDRRLEDGSAIEALLDLQDRLSKDLEADWLLADARTGITPTNAVTTNVLADTVVVLSLELAEQLEGTRSLLRSLQPLTSLRSEEPLDLHMVLSRVPPLPSDIGIYGGSEADEARVERIRVFMNEPAQPLRRTLRIEQIHLVHTDAQLLGGDFVTSAERSPKLRTVLHVDYARILASVFGKAVDGLLEQSGEDRPASWLEDVGELLARPELVVAAKAELDLSAGAQAPTSMSLEDQVASVRALAKANAALLPDLASRLMGLDREYSRLGRREEAAQATREAVEVYRALLEADREGYLPSFASALNDHGLNLGELGRRDEALATIEEAVHLRRQLAEANPAAYTPNLATSLNNLANQLGALGRDEEAGAALLEARELRSGLLRESSGRPTPE